MEKKEIKYMRRERKKEGDDEKKGKETEKGKKKETEINGIKRTIKKQKKTTETIMRGMLYKTK